MNINVEIKNPVYNRDGSVDVEMNHPQWGWIPFTASPDDEVEHGKTIHASSIAGEFGEISPYIAPVLVQADYEKAIQEMMDGEARNNGYDSILSAASYAGYTNSFQADGVTFGEWRSAVWEYCYVQLVLVESGGRTQPSVDELLVEINTNTPLVLQ